MKALKRSGKKAIILLLALSMLFSLAIPVAAAENSASTSGEVQPQIGLLGADTAHPLVAAGSDPVTVNYTVNAGIDYEWKYFNSPDFSDESHNAYVSGNRGSTEIYVSNISVTVSGAGTFSFDYKLSIPAAGDGYALYYKVGAPITQENYKTAANYTRHADFCGITPWKNEKFTVSPENLNGEGKATVYIAYLRTGTLSGENWSTAAIANVSFKGQDKEDYTISLDPSATNVNAGESFTVDVNISSASNAKFYGATIELSYDNSKLAYDSSVLPAGFGVSSSANTGTLTIAGADLNGNGYALENGSFTVATLIFEVGAETVTNSTSIGISDFPVVDQENAVESVYVNKGPNIPLNIWNLSVTFKAGANVSMADSVAYVKYNEPGLWMDKNYSQPFVEPEPTPATSYTLISPRWAGADGERVNFADIAVTSFNANAVYTADAVVSKFDITHTTNIIVESGVTDGKAEYLNPIVFTVAIDSGYVLNTVTYTVGAGEAITPDPPVGGMYTIPGDKITDNINISASQKIAGSAVFIPNDNYKALPTGYKLLILTVDTKLSSGAYEYSGNAMFCSSGYSADGAYAYLYIVPNAVSYDDAIANIQIDTASTTCTNLLYEGDVNCDGKRNSTDAVLSYALYRGLWTGDEFTKVDMRMRLEADVNGDKVVDTSDAQLILYKIWGISP